VIGISGSQRTVEIDRVLAVESFFCERIEGLPTRTSQIFSVIPRDARPLK
jgi:hypothetical protein